MPGSTQLWSTSFKRVYPANVDLTVAPYDAVVTTPTAAITTLPAGSVSTRGWHGIDIAFYGTDAEDEEFAFELWALMRTEDSPGAGHVAYIESKILDDQSGLGDSILSAFTGVAGATVDENQFFADTFGAILETNFLSSHMQAFVTDSADEKELANQVGLVSLRGIAGIDYIRIHPYAAGGGNDAATMNAIYRLVGPFAQS